MNETSNRSLLAQRDKKIRNWRIVAGVLLLLVVYGLVGRMDRDAQVDLVATAKQRPVPMQKLTCIGRTTYAGWI